MMFNKKDYAKEYYQKNKERLAKTSKKRYEAKREEILEKCKEYVKKNKEIISAKRKIYRAKMTPEQMLKWKQQQEDYAKNNPERVILAHIKSRSKKKNVEFDLDITDIKIPDVCPVFKTPFIKEYIKGGKPGPKNTFNAPSIDRIDNTKGYIKGNIQVISHKANSMKNSASPEELLQFAFWVLLTYGHLIDKEIKGDK